MKLSKRKKVGELNKSKDIKNITYLSSLWSAFRWAFYRPGRTRRCHSDLIVTQVGLSLAKVRLQIESCQCLTPRRLHIVSWVGGHLYTWHKKYEIKTWWWDKSRVCRHIIIAALKERLIDWTYLKKSLRIEQPSPSLLSGLKAICKHVVSSKLIIYAPTCWFWP